MEIYNKGQRSFIIAREAYLSDNIIEASDSIGKRYAHIRPDTVCDVEASVAKSLIARYPKEIVAWGKYKSKKKE